VFGQGVAQYVEHRRRGRIADGGQVTPRHIDCVAGETEGFGDGLQECPDTDG
jgi:hypothetical protein